MQCWSRQEGERDGHKIPQERVVGNIDQLAVSSTPTNDPTRQATRLQ